MQGLKPKEMIWSYAFTSTCIGLSTQLSYRKTAEWLNTVLRRSMDSRVKARTLADFAENYGYQIGAYLKTVTDEILNDNNFTAPDDLSAGEWPESPDSADEDVEWDMKNSVFAASVADINVDREPAEQIKPDACLSDIELPDDRCCYISIDDIGVKKQKTTRKDGGSKEGKYVENTVIHVQTGTKYYLLTAVGLDNAFRMLMAFLLSNSLLENHRLVFLADGAKSIKNCIERYFSSAPYVLILDWYHLKKKCKELISSSIKGSIEEKKQLAKDLLRILWVGNTDEAIAYLKSLPKSKIKSEHWLEELTGYLERKKAQITCYALRHNLGLRISSNRVEKANDMLVGERQKHNGMSWSPKGSSALAAISMVLHNGEAEQWLRTHSLNFSIHEDAAA